MRRRAGLLFGWLVVTTTAIALALAAVGLVTDSVTENRPASLSAAAVADALKESSTATSEPATTAPTEPTGPTGPTGPTTTTSTPAQSTTTRPAPRSTTTRPAPTTTTTSKTTVSTGEHDDTQSPPPAPGAAEDRTYNLTGGSAAVRFEGGQARLLWATPRPGFQLDSSGDSEDVDIRFRSDSHESRLRAYWDNGPHAEIEEK